MGAYTTELQCVCCSTKFDAADAQSPAEVWMTCPQCGQAGILDIHYDLERVREAWNRKPLASRAGNHWRYEELLPLQAEAVPHEWPTGWTPVLNVPRLADHLGIRQVLLKDDGRNPTGSFKDRASSVGVAHARQVGAETIACASTGNAATSLAGHAALAGLPAVIFVPKRAPEAKMAQLLIFGATVFSVQSSYDAAYDLCTAACNEFGWYNRNCAINPVLVEGKKTAGLEIAEQCADLGIVPDWVVVSIGDGCTIAGIWKGLNEMKTLGVIDRLPRLLGVQAAGVAPIEYALEHDALPSPDDGTTIADSIDVHVPRNWRKAVRALRESNGALLTAGDEDILEAMRLAGRHGMFAEPAAAASVAGLVKAVDAGTIKPDERVLAMITGSGLKDTKSAILAGGAPIPVEPELAAVEQAWEEHSTK